MNDLMDAMVVAIAALELTIPIAQGQGTELVPIPTAKRKLPQVGEDMTPAPPCIIVCPSEVGDSIVPISTNGYWLGTYPLQCVIIAPGNQDMSTNLDYYCSMREAIRNLFVWSVGSIGPSQGVEGITRKNAKILDRDKVNQNYDYMPMDITVQMRHKF